MHSPEMILAICDSAMTVFQPTPIPVPFYGVINSDPLKRIQPKIYWYSIFPRSSFDPACSTPSSYEFYTDDTATTPYLGMARYGHTSRPPTIVSVAEVFSYTFAVKMIWNGGTTYWMQ